MLIFALCWRAARCRRGFVDVAQSSTQPEGSNIRPTGRVYVSGPALLPSRADGCQRRQPTIALKTASIRGPRRKKPRPPPVKSCTPRQVPIAQTMRASACGAWFRNLRSAIHQSPGHSDGRGKTASGKPGAQRSSCGSCVSGRGLGDEPPHRHRARKKLRLMHRLLHRLGHTRAQEAGLAAVQPCGNRR